MELLAFLQQEGLPILISLRKLGTAATPQDLIGSKVDAMSAYVMTNTDPFLAKILSIKFIRHAR